VIISKGCLLFHQVFHPVRDQQCHQSQELDSEREGRQVLPVLHWRGLPGSLLTLPASCLGLVLLIEYCLEEPPVWVQIVYPEAGRRG